MEFLKQLITRILGSGLLSTALVLVRAVTVLMVLYVIWRCYTSFKKGQRRKDPVVMLEDAATGAHFPVLYWENSIGRSRSCDIQIPDNSVSRDHAVLMRREEGWFVCDTGSHAGTRVRNKQITEPTLVQIGDKIRMGSTTLTLRNASDVPQKKRSMFTGFSKEAASPFKLMLVVTLVQMSLTLQLMIGTGEFRLYPAAPFVILFTASWVLYFFSRRILKRVSFEIETVGLLLSSIGILLLSGEGLDTVKMQIAAFGIGIVLFCFLVWFMSDLERVMKLRLYIAIGAILLFVANLVLGKDVNGSRNWIFIGPFSFQPSEFIKIAFVFVGASTLDHLQTKRTSRSSSCSPPFASHSCSSCAISARRSSSSPASSSSRSCAPAVSAPFSSSSRQRASACSSFCSLNPTLPSASRAGCTCGSTHRTASATSRCAP